MLIKIYEITNDQGDTYFKYMTDRQKSKFKKTAEGKAALTVKLFQKLKLSLKIVKTNR